jgi:hypothetical protein
VYGLVCRWDLVTENEPLARTPLPDRRTTHSLAAPELAAARFPGPKVRGSRSPSRAA